MDCSLVRIDLIAYQFATIADDDRARLEAHLVECTTCLKIYLALKGAVDRGDGELPSEATRLALRGAVEARFRPTLRRRAGRWLTRPVPLYQSMCLVAGLALAAAVAPALGQALWGSTQSHSTERVDTSRPTAESVTIY